jgi:predicted MPP superfamily phosphohydrolase
MKLEIGYNSSFEIRKENCSAKNGENFSILYLSDLHFNKYSEQIALKIIYSINDLNPDIILLGGDYADTPKGLKIFNTLLQKISNRNNIFAVAGNHDYFIGIEKIEKIIVSNNINWIEKKSLQISINNSPIIIDGNFQQKEKLQNAYYILCTHKPVNIKNHQSRYDIAFSGHLHGSQIVLWTRKEKLYPGILFYKWNRLKLLLYNCNYYISKGLGDTLPIRYNCKKEILFITVN